MNIKQILTDLISPDYSQAQIGICKNASMGHYTISAFRYKDQTEKIANLLKHKLIQSVNIVGPYINIFINQNVAAEITLNRALDNNFAKLSHGKGKTVCIDFSSINIAKPFHIGHLGTTVIGASVAKILQQVGYKVVKINYLGDFGTQFGKIINAIKTLHGGKVPTSLKDLNDIYVNANKLCEENEEFLNASKAQSLLLEQKDKQNTELYEQIRQTTLNELEKIYKTLGVTFDDWRGELHHQQYTPLAKQLLEKNNLLVESQGLYGVNLEQHKLGFAPVFRSDGASIYLARDIATVIKRKEEFNYAKNLYVVATQQNLHFKQLFKIMDLCGDYQELTHITYGMVRMAEGSLSTRKGTVIWLQDVLDKAIEKAMQTVKEKNSNLANSSEIAEKVGVGAVLFSTLCNARNNDIVFDYNKILSFDGETSPYLQYTYARINSIVEKAGKVTAAADYTKLGECSELIKLVDSFEEVILNAAKAYEPCYISRHLLDIASELNKYYAKEKVLVQDEAELSAKLNLIKAVQKTLNVGLSLLGIQPLEQM